MDVEGRHQFVEVIWLLVWAIAEAVASFCNAIAGGAERAFVRRRERRRVASPDRSIEEDGAVSKEKHLFSSTLGMVGSEFPSESYALICFAGLCACALIVLDAPCWSLLTVSLQWLQMKEEAVVGTVKVLLNVVGVT